MDFQMFAVVIVFLACVEQSLASCVVDSFTVKQDFDPTRVSTQTCLLEVLRHPQPGQSEAPTHSALMTELICNTHVCNSFSALVVFYLLYLYVTLLKGSIRRRIGESELNNLDM